MIIDDKYLIIDDSLNIFNFFDLNTISDEILSLLNKERNEEEILKLLNTKYEVNLDSLKKKVKNIKKKLEDLNIVSK